jgi:hypothetical protein
MNAPRVTVSPILEVGVAVRECQHHNGTVGHARPESLDRTADGVLAPSA